MNRAARSINTLCALLVAGGGLAAVVGWVLHIEVLTRLNSTFIPTQFNSAVCFTFYGLGLGALNWQWRWIGRALASVVLLIGLITLFEHVLGSNSGIDTLAGYYLPGPAHHPGRMATATSIAITSLGGALLLFSHQAWNERKSAIVAMLGSIAAAVGLGGFLSFAAQLQSTTGWVGFTQIGFPSATLCLLAGANILLNVGARVNAGTIWLPIPLGAGLLALLFTLMQALSADQDAAFSQRVQTAAWDLEGEAETQMHDMFAAIDRMVNRWDLGAGTDPRVWNGDAAAYFQAYPGLNALVWGDTTGKIGRISSLTPEAVGGRKLGDQMALSARGREAATDAVRTGKAQISRAITLRDGQLGFLYINPVTNNGAPDGILLAAISFKRLFANVLKQSGDPGYVMVVEEEGRTIFSNATPSSPGVDARWVRQAHFVTGKVHWVVKLTPTPMLLAAGRSSLPTIFFLTGLAFVALITASVFFALRSRQNERLIQLHEEDLERSEERYELAVRGSGVGLWDRDVARETLYCSPRVLEVMGITDPAYVPDRNELLTRVHPDDIARVMTELGQAVMERRAYDLEGRVRRQDGTYIWVRLRGMPVFGSDGVLARVAGSLDDITQLKAAEAALKASEETFRVTMEAAPVGKALISPEKKLIKVNRALQVLTGYSEEELLSMDLRALFPAEYEEDGRQIDRLLAGEIDNYTMEQTYFTKDGRPVWALVIVSLARRPDGSPRHMVKQIMDISERKEMDRMKSEFISVVSHELRTPLTAIRGSLGLMATAMKDQLPAKALHLVEIGYRNSERLIALVNDILDMEKLAANRMAFEFSHANLTDLAMQAVEGTAAYAEKYKVSYVVENRAADLPVLVDTSRMGQVFANLLSNAAKFSPEGGRVRVGIRTRGGRARVEVADRGAGISEEFKSRIFGRFVQADSSVTRAKGGTGLGLHITRELVERMGGKIGFDSALGQGTTFWVEFPLAEAPEELELAPAPAASALPRILHVEDDADLTAMLAAALKGRANLVAARTVKDAQAKLKTHNFDAIILDIGMPDGSGLSLIQGITRVANPPPVIILSAREIEEKLDTQVAAILVKSRIAETEIADKVMAVVAEQVPLGHKAAS